MSYVGHLPEIGTGIIGKAVTATLYVSPNGSNTNGRTWAEAYNTIQTALDAASTDANDLTLIMISPHATNYDINTTGDPTWTGNYILKGSHRNWAKIKNTHATADSIMKFTGNVCLNNLHFDLHTADDNGIILTNDGFRIYNCQFIGVDLTGAATALHLDGASVISNGKIIDTKFCGEGTNHMTAILIDTCARSFFEDLSIHKCKTAIQIVNAGSDFNTFKTIDIGDSGIGLDIDVGSEQHFSNINFHHCTTNVDDEVGDHHWRNITDSLAITIEPDDFTGIELAADNAADTWGADTEIRAAVASTVPFRIVAVHLKPAISQWYRVRFSADSGATFYDDLMLDATKREGAAAPSGTEFIFNKGTRISASTKAETGGEDKINVWIEIQEI